MREKGQTEAAKTLETPVFSRGIEILTEKLQFVSYLSVTRQKTENPTEFKAPKKNCNNSNISLQLSYFIVSN